MKKNLLNKLSAFIVVVMMFSATSTNAQWVSKASGFSAPYRGIAQLFAVNTDVAWGSAYDGLCTFCAPITEFTRTIDGGKHWTTGNISAFPNDHLLGLSPITKNIAYAITTNSSLTVNRILKTNDGGATWTTQRTLGGGRVLNDIHFFNALDGIVYGGQTNGYLKILITNDGGQHWQRVPQANLPVTNPTEEIFIYSGTSVCNTFWGVSTDARVWKTVDKGLHWTAYNTPATQQDAFEDVSNIKMRDALHGLLGFHDALYRTNDGGVSWTAILPVGTWFTNGLDYVPGAAATWVSTGGDVNSSYGALHGLGSSYSIDDGNTWITIDTAVDHLAVEMVSSNKGFCGGFNINRTTNGISIFRGAPLQRMSSENILNQTSSATSIFPNPISNSSTISFSLSQSQKVSLKIFDVNGRLIKTLADKYFEQGENKIEWNAEEVNAGIYFLQFKSAENLQTEKLIVTK